MYFRARLPNNTTSHTGAITRLNLEFHPLTPATDTGVR